ncbi:MAG: hypothetical protein RXN84_06390 [Caldivirga sp.]|uniref:hypothetical protein n=1 Tax=Caldivirga sp. MU80 TaxID=1650354 RepID=UPI0012E8F958|nr:hypothetical protein [Caldivirga sp. MU80]
MGSDVGLIMITTRGKVWRWGKHRFAMVVKDSEVVEIVKKTTSKHTRIQLILNNSLARLIYDVTPAVRKAGNKEYLVLRLVRQLNSTWSTLYLAGEIPIEIIIPSKTQ